MPIRIYCLAAGKIIHFILQKMVIIQIYYVCTYRYRYTFISICMYNVWLANSINKIFNRLSLLHRIRLNAIHISPKVDGTPIAINAGKMKEGKQFFWGLLLISDCTELFLEICPPFSIARLKSGSKMEVIFWSVSTYGMFYTVAGHFPKFRHDYSSHSNI